MSKTDILKRGLTAIKREYANSPDTGITIYYRIIFILSILFHNFVQNIACAEAEEYLAMDTIILIVIFSFILAGFTFLRHINKNNKATEEHHEHDSEDGVCCGKHTNCAKGYDNSNLYFDDEELDKFKGKKAEEYIDSDIEEFRQVLYTMREEEVETWAHCLETRGIEIPQEVKDEILLMLQ